MLVISVANELRHRILKIRLGCSSLLIEIEVQNEDIYSFEMHRLNWITIEQLWRFVQIRDVQNFHEMIIFVKY